MNTESGETAKVFTLRPDSVFTFGRIKCSRWTGLGVHDGPEYAFCLADDLLEPYRPLVDWQIRSIVEDAGANSTLEVREHRATLLGLLNRTVATGEAKLPVQIAIERSASSLASSLAGAAAVLTLPSSLPLPADAADTES